MHLFTPNQADYFCVAVILHQVLYGNHVPFRVVTESGQAAYRRGWVTENTDEGVITAPGSNMKRSVDSISILGYN